MRARLLKKDCCTKSAALIRSKTPFLGFTSRRHRETINAFDFRRLVSGRLRQRGQVLLLIASSKSYRYFHGHYAAGCVPGIQSGSADRFLRYSARDPADSVGSTSGDVFKNWRLHQWFRNRFQERLNLPASGLPSHYVMQSELN
ncbi:hypothetical protein AVEN_210104-1 [Araneus ventricosus]|uniref:Uncharacterized protein n=1 Tax=Araneus ventricosus TaxID=182803 RepID=A0A4Y2GB26_ARAVE|nr:hypothetical protein AVEN_210104-1 [Araneus ventricosus]